MSWVTILWAMVASACLTLAVVHGLVWVRQRDAWANLLFAITAVGTAGMAATEYWMLRSETVGAYETALRWFHVPVWITFLALLGFVRFYLKAGRSWLAWTAAVLRTASLVLNFVQPPNLNYREISALRRIAFLGDSVPFPVGQPNPNMLIGQLSLLCLVLFVLDATVTAWRGGRRWQAAVVGGSTTLFVTASTAMAIAVFWGWLEWPISASLFFTGTVAAMGYELSSDLLRAAQLAANLRQREGELRRERALTDAVFDSVPGLLYLYSQKGQLCRWNRQHETRTGYSSAELARMQVSDWFDPEDLEGMRTAWDKAFCGVAVATELPLKMKDGTRVPYLLTGVRVLIEDQPHLVGIGIDIAEQKAMEQEATRTRAELAHLSRVASLSELSGSLAHELNQPLAIILTNAQAARRLLLQQPPDLAETVHIVDDIAHEARRAGEVIKRLRAWLKRGEPQRQLLHINEILEEVLGLMRSDLISRGIRVKREFSDGLPPLCGDRIGLEQVMLNLVTNAADAMANTPVAERLLTLVSGRDGSAVRVSVRDAGGGLPAESGRIFDPFFTTKPQGLGMGLSICRTLLALHGGRLWAEPNTPQGAVFHVEIPADRGST